MPSKRTMSERLGRKALVALILLAYVPFSNWTVCNCAAIELPLVSSKKPSLQVPGYEKMIDGAGPQTNDTFAAPITNPNGLIDENASTKPQDLSPMTLHDQSNGPDGNNGSSGNATSSIEGSDTTDGAMLKSTVTTTDYVPKESDAKEMQSQSIKGTPDGKTLVRQAGKVGLNPIPLT